MAETEERLQIYRILAENPGFTEVLTAALKVEEEGEKRYREAGFGEYHGWEWFSVHCPTPTLNRMVAAKLLDITLKTRSGTEFRVRNPELVREAIAALEAPLRLTTSQGEGIPDGLFEVIVGHEGIKWAFRQALMAANPVHILLVGPVATAKSLFLGELSLLEGSRYALGSAFSKAGLVDYLLEYQPRYLLVDELEKSDGRDLAALLSLMQSGIVTRLKKGMREQITLKTWVFAAANAVQFLPQEIKSRFLLFYLREYTVAEFKSVAAACLRREGVPEDLVVHIVEALVPYTKDVRDAIKLGRLCRSQEDIAEVVRLIWQG